MTYEQAKDRYFNELKEANDCLTIEELIARLGRTTIRCGWVDFVDSLVKNGDVKESVAYKWGQVL